jgi:hypothetical protein
MTELTTIIEDIFEQAKNTALLGLETNTRLIRFKIQYLNLIIDGLKEINETNPFENYRHYCWIVNKNIRWLQEELDEHEPGVRRLLLRLDDHRDDEQYLMNCHLRVSEHIKLWNEDYDDYVTLRNKLESGEMSVLDTFKCIEEYKK